jgi:hypothetical protein
MTLGAILVTTLLTSDCGPNHPEETSPEYLDPGMTGDPKENPELTRAYLGRLTFASRPNASTIECGGGVRTTVNIYPEVRSHHLSEAEAKRRPRIVARVVNAGPNRCDELHLAVRDTAYWWTGPNRGYPLTTDFWRIPANPTDSIRHLAQTGPVRFT